MTWKGYKAEGRPEGPHERVARTAAENAPTVVQETVPPVEEFRFLQLSALGWCVLLAYILIALLAFWATTLAVRLTTLEEHWTYERSDR